MKTLCIVMALLFSGLIWGQNLAALESRYAERQREMTAVQARLDSLQAALERQAERIETAKRSPDADKSSIRRLLAEGLEVSAQVEEQQKRVAVLQEQLKTLRWELAQAYSAAIDSLQQREKSVDDRIAKQALAAQIARYTERYLLFSPAFRALSFDPHKVQELHPAAMEDSLERAMARDYLQRAAADVKEHLQQIKHNRSEVEQIVRLERKTREFLEEVDAERLGMGVFSQSRSSALSAQREETIDSPTGVQIAREQRLQQLQSLTLFFNQLGLENPAIPGGNKKVAVDSGQIYLSLEEYLRLLKAAEKRLQEFQELISAKLPD